MQLAREIIHSAYSMAWNEISPIPRAFKSAARLAFGEIVIIHSVMAKFEFALLIRLNVVSA